MCPITVPSLISRPPRWARLGHAMHETIQLVSYPAAMKYKSVCEGPGYEAIKTGFQPVPVLQVVVWLARLCRDLQNAQLFFLLET